MPKGTKNPLWWGLGARLRKISDEKALTQAVLAQLVGVSSTLISGIQRGVREPTLDILERLAAALGVSAAWLTFGDQSAAGAGQGYAQSVTFLAPAARESAVLCKELGSRLRRARERRPQLSLLTLAKEAGISPQGLMLVESGANIPRIGSVEALAKALEVAPGWLAFGEGEGPTELSSASPTIN